MSFQRAGKPLRWLGLAAILTFSLPSFGWAQMAGPFLSAFSCGPGCNTHCPPAFKYLYEGPPHIHWHRGCPHPICNPCDLPNWGYHETCWTPYPFPPNWSHCPTLPPAAKVVLDPFAGMPMPVMTPPVRNLPAPTLNTPLRLPPSNPPVPLDNLPSPRPLN